MVCFDFCGSYNQPSCSHYFKNNHSTIILSNTLFTTPRVTTLELENSTMDQIAAIYSPINKIFYLKSWEFTLSMGVNNLTISKEIFKMGSMIMIKSNIGIGSVPKKQNDFALDQNGKLHPLSYQLCVRALTTRYYFQTKYYNNTNRIRFRDASYTRNFDFSFKHSQSELDYVFDGFNYIWPNISSGNISLIVSLYGINMQNLIKKKTFIILPGEISYS
jgi:hypothetical protein